MSCLGIKYIRLPSASFFGFFGTYEIVEDWAMKDCGFYPEELVEAFDYSGAVVVSLEPSGRLTLFQGMVFDGPSAIAWDRKENIEPSAVHDGLYRLCRTGLVKAWRKLQLIADKLYGKQCHQCGMWKWWAKLNEWAVRWKGRKSARPQAEEQLQVRE